MPSWVIDILLTEAAVFILVMTGCFVAGMVYEAIRQRYERWSHELADMPYGKLEAMAFGRSACGYPFGMVADELDRRSMSFQRGTMTTNEWRGMMQASPEEVAEFQRENIRRANSAEGAMFYADNSAYTVVTRYVPPPYGTTERK